MSEEAALPLEFHGGLGGKYVYQGPYADPSEIILNYNGELIYSGRYDDPSEILADHETISTTVDLRPSATPLDVKYVLEKQKGSFSITSTPEGAQVFIGGQYRGTTPLQGSLEVGQYEVEVKLEGYNAPKQGMKVQSTTTAQLSFAMRDRSSAACIDPAGREYKTVQIGEQLWMAENLAYKPPTGNYWAYDNVPKNVVTYGYLYDWETAKKVCPEGWHLPTDAEWTVLTDFLGGESRAGGKMKNKTGWEPRNTDATNESGFVGVPGGFRNDGGDFYTIGYNGHWWSSSAASGSAAWYRNLNYNDGDADRNSNSWSFGFSVRCVRD